MCSKVLLYVLLPFVSSLKTSYFVPEPINITVDSLPTERTKSHRATSYVVKPENTNETLFLPDGFQANIFSEGIPLNSPRWLALTPDGAVLVTETPDDRIRLLRDTDGDGVADETFTFADHSNGLYIPFGMAFVRRSNLNYWFVVGHTNEVRKYRYRLGDTNLGNQTGVKIADLPGLGYNQHWTRNVVDAENGR